MYAFFALLKKIQKYFQEKSEIFSRNQMIVYNKKLSQVKSEVMDNGLFCKKADLDDMEHLAVAMQIRKFSILKRRLENENCFLIKKDEKIQSYFWFTHNCI